MIDLLIKNENILSPFNKFCQLSDHSRFQDFSARMQITLCSINDIASSSVLLERTILGATLHYDEPVYSQALLYDGSIDPVINIEAQFYSKKNTSYYIFSRHVKQQRLIVFEHIEHRYLKRALELVCLIDGILHHSNPNGGWVKPRVQYHVDRLSGLDLFGINFPKAWNRFCNQLENQAAVYSFKSLCQSIKLLSRYYAGLPNRWHTLNLSRAQRSTTKFLHGRNIQTLQNHQRFNNTSECSNYAIRLFAYDHCDQKYTGYHLKIRKSQLPFFHYIYYARYHLADVKYGGQAVYNMEVGQILATDSLIYGDTIFEELTTDPVLLPKMGTLFPVNTFMQSYQGTYVITNPKDFTVEVWIRINYGELQMGQVQTLVAKVSTATGKVEYGIHLTDRALRISFKGQYKDVHYPPLIDSSINFINASYSFLGRDYNFTKSKEWRMIAVNFRQAPYFETGSFNTLAYVYLDGQPVQDPLIFDQAYVDIAAAYMMVGKNFQGGLIRSIIIFSQFLRHTEFHQGILKEQLREYYPHISINNITVSSQQQGSCKRFSNMQSPCDTCTKHLLSGGTATQDTCFNTCPINTFDYSCSQCDPRCKYCTQGGPNACLRCSNDGTTAVVQSNYIFNEKTCLKDFGYYKSTNNQTQEYKKCDYRCLLCKDGTNICEMCALEAFRHMGKYCVAECPNGYFGNQTSKMCQRMREDQSLQYPQECSKGQYFDQKRNSCSLCSSNCLTCDQFDQCLSCRLGSYTISISASVMIHLIYLNRNAKCSDCANHINMTQDSNGECQEKCGKGINYGGLQCDDGNQINGDGCSDTCEVEPSWTCSGIDTQSTCTKSKSLIQEVQVTQTNQVIVYLSQNANITEDQVKINVQGMHLDDEFNQNNNITFSVIQFNKVLGIMYDFNQSGIDYSNQELLISIQDMQIRAQLNNIEKQKFEDLIDLNKVQMHQLLGIVLQGFFMIIILSNIMQSILIFKPMAFSFIAFSILQQLYCTRLLNLDHSPYFAIGYQPLSFSLFTFKIRGISDLIKQNLINDYTKEGIYGQKFTESGFIYNQTLVSLSTIGIIWLFLLFFVAPLFLLIGALLRRQQQSAIGVKQSLWKPYEELFNLKIFLSVAFLFSTLSILPTSLASILELSFYQEDPDDSTHLDTYSYYSAQAILSIMLLFVVFMTAFIIMSRELHMHELLRAKVPASTIYEPFKNNAFALVIYPLYCAKGLLIALILTQVNQFETQVGLMTGIDTIYSLYAIIVRPFKIFEYNIAIGMLELAMTLHWIVFWVTKDPMILQTLDVSLFGTTAAYFGMWRTWKSLYKWYYWIKLGKLPPRPQKAVIGREDLNQSSSKLLSNKSMITETPLKDEGGPTHPVINNNLMTQTQQ